MSKQTNVEKIISFRSSNLEFKIFLVAVLMLASAPFISCLLFLYPLFKGLLKSKLLIINDKLNQIFIFISLILILQSIFYTLNGNNQLVGWQSSLHWAGIANLIPLFICFMGFNSYLDNPDKRETVTKFFIAGTVPVLISCVGQYWFNWYGPFEIFNGLIKWFQRPLITNQNVTGLFSNPNYTGAWLTMMLPLSISLLKEKIYTRELIKVYIMFLITGIISLSLVLTNSRNAWIGAIIVVPFLLNKKKLKYYILLITFLFVLIISSFLPIFPLEIRTFTQKIVPITIVDKLSEIILYLDTYPRIDIWNNAINFISDKPLFGWGADSFSYLYYLKTGLNNAHAHNLFLELSINYGIIISSLIISILIIILSKSFIYIFIKNNKFLSTEKGWWGAGLIFFLTHFYDVLIYDIRINLASWIFIIGLRNVYYSQK